jgi:hypothetical protein
MSAPLPTTELFAFRTPSVKPGGLVVPVLLQGGEWAAISAPRNVWEKFATDLRAALDAPRINPGTNRPTRYNKQPRPTMAS